jgi:inner membrane protein
MDNLTHAALGIAAGIAVHRRGGSVSAAAVAALLASEAPDLDVFIRAADDPLVAFRWHRHFTHSFVFMPVLALAAAWLTTLFFRRRHNVGWRELFLPGLAGALTHLLCDGCTSYGTMLLWPFTEARFAWDCLPIIDLAVTLPVLTFAVLAWRRHSPRLAAYGLLWFGAYAALGLTQQARAERSLRTWLATQSVTPERLAVKPTVSNLIVWRAVWLHQGRWHVAAVRNVPFTRTRLAVGETRAAWTPASPGNPPPFSEGSHLIADFSRFTGGWNTYDQADGAILVGDIRFAMLPTSSRPLWSVRCAPGGTLAETTLVMDRSLRDGDWGRLGALLSGSEPRFIDLE